MKFTMSEEIIANLLRGGWMTLDQMQLFDCKTNQSLGLTLLVDIEKKIKHLKTEIDELILTEFSLFLES